MSVMDLATEHNASRALERGIAFTNLAQAAVLLLAFGALTTAVLWPEFGRGAIAIAAVAGTAIVAAAMRIPPATMMQLYGARPYQAGDLAQFENITSELARRAGLRSSPRLYVVPSMSVSAFSFGSSASFATAVTEGLLRRLTMREVAALLAREAAHAKRGDLLVLGIADFIARCAQAFYYTGLALAALNILRGIGGSEPVPWVSVLLLLLAPTLMTALQLGLSRTREIDADRAGALLTGDPLGVASAVSRLDATPGTALEELIPPVPARKVPLPSMLRFAPPAEQRIALLNALQAPPMPQLDIAEGPRISLIGVGPIEMRPRYRWPGVWF
jgi:heat shock protein HtpX